MKKSRKAAPAVSRGSGDRKSTPIEEPVFKTATAVRHVPLRKVTRPANQTKQSLLGVRDNNLEIAIGHEVRAIRASRGMTASDLARASNLSLGMLSKIENGITSASLTTLQRVAMGLGVQVTALFRSFDETREAVYVRSGRGLLERYPRRAGQQCQPLGYPDGLTGSVAPRLITLTERTQEFPIIRHAGYEFIYMLQGEVLYRHSSKSYRLRSGDSLYFDAAAVHGPEELVKLPIRLLSVTSAPHDASRG